MYTPLVFVDLETTGCSSAGDRITEVGVVEVIPGPPGQPERVTHWSTLVNPQCTITPFIQHLTGITDDMVRHAPTFADIAPALFARLEGKLFIAHNASFDLGFLRASFARLGMTFYPDVLCTVRLSRALFPAQKRHGLDALIERYALAPSGRHRALADADLLWQFWQRLPGLVAPDELHAQIENVTRRYRMARHIPDERLDTAPAGHGIYAFYDEHDAPLYVGHSVRVRQRIRSYLWGERRSAREQRIAQQIHRVEWQATGGEVGALLVEAQWVERLRPAFNRAPKKTPSDPAFAPWPFDGAVQLEERDAVTGEPYLHLIDQWHYLGCAHTAQQARTLAVAGNAAARSFEPATYQILQPRLAHGLRVRPVGADALSDGRARRA